MGKTVSLVGIRAEELDLVRMLVGLLRHEDPNVAELTRQALYYLKDTTVATGAPVICSA
jgi:hypothetical protein